MVTDMAYPPVFDVSEVSRKVLDDMRAACAPYHRTYGLTEAFDRLRTIPDRSEYIESVASGKVRGVEPVERLVEWLLRPWHSIRNFPQHAKPAAGQALSHAQDVLLQLPGGLSLEVALPEQISLMATAYSSLADCPYVGGTNASKMLAALRPELFPMWDDKIADAYGFCREGTGYRRFVTLMAGVARRLRELSTGQDESLEDYIRPAERAWSAPLAKLIDEWHWVRITKGVSG